MRSRRSGDGLGATTFGGIGTSHFRLLVGPATSGQNLNLVTSLAPGSRLVVSALELSRGKRPHGGPSESLIILKRLCQRAQPSLPAPRQEILDDVRQPATKLQN